MRTRKMKRWLSILLAGLAAVILIAAAGGAFLFRHELKTLHSLKKVDDNVLYTMKYDGDYGFDEFLETGASSDSELVEFVTNRLLKGIPLEFSIPDLGCSTFSAQTEDGARIFGRNFDLTYSPAMFVLTEPANGYRSMSTVNLAFLGFGEDKLPDTLKRKIITLAAPYAPLDGVNEKGLAVAVLRIGDELQTRIRERQILPPPRLYVLCWIRPPMWMRPWNYWHNTTCTRRPGAATTSSWQMHWATVRWQSILIMNLKLSEKRRLPGCNEFPAVREEI